MMGKKGRYRAGKSVGKKTKIKNAFLCTGYPVVTLCVINNFFNKIKLFREHLIFF